MHTVVGDTLFYARRFDRSIEPYRKGLELDPAFDAAHTDLARSLEHVGRTDEALEEFLRGTPRTNGRPQPSTGSRFSTLVWAGVTRRVPRWMQCSRWRGSSFVSPYGIASYYAVTGDAIRRSTGWKSLRRARRNAGVAQGAPTTRSIRGEPRFRDLLARMRLE